MTPASTPLQNTGLNRRDCIFALTAVAAGLAGCGGGGGSFAGISSGGTGFVSVGTVRGFGSVIVNTIRFDDNSATFTDDDGSVRSRDDLRLGMVAAVDGSNVTATTGTARSVSFGAQMVGRVTAIDLNNRRFFILEQRVEITGSTIFEAEPVGGVPGLPLGLASLAVGDVVEIHGFSKSEGLTATRVQREAQNTQIFRVQGEVGNHDSAARTFRIGALRIEYSTANVAFTPTNGAQVRVRLVAANPAPAVWSATRIARAESSGAEGSKSEIEGNITAFTSASTFSVNGIAVDASAVATPPGLALGVRVEVKGSFLGGVLVATEVELEDGARVDSLEFEFEGPISPVVGNTFVIRGVTVNFVALSPTYINGNAAKLIGYTGVLEVKGTAGPSGTDINATRIEFKS
ncbi:MAG: DUF5666 domain-containing protein [Burkholderiales bacterium]|nr:DUF5666 domain-containing protein [Burkholderiales bacterium]